MTVLWVVLTVCVLTTLIALACALQLSRRLVLSEAGTKQQLELLRRELAGVNNAAMGVGQRLISVEKKLKISMEKQQQLDLHHSDYLPYSQASSLDNDGDNKITTLNEFRGLLFGDIFTSFGMPDRIYEEIKDKH